jgi:hypothetical protein
MAELLIDDQTATPMRPWRVRMVYAVVGVIVLGHLYEIARQREHWPFSNYPMWAQVTDKWELKNVDVVGVTDSADAAEVKLDDPAYFAPLPVYYQRLILGKFARRQSTRERVFADYLRRYEQRRKAGLHHGPPLKGLRAYEVVWTMDPTASNVRTPDRRAVLYESPATATGPASAPASAPATTPAPTPAGGAS